MIEHLLVPHDLTERSDAGLGAASALGAAIGTLHVVHVLARIDPTTPGVVWPRDEDTRRTEHARTALTARLRGTPYAGAIVHVKVGDPASRIVELAREIGAGLIVVPSHSRTGLPRLVLGSVAEHVARFAPCPVLVLPAGA
ncbi:MAG: universal stress protein, partial [Myxococcota bacterium]